MDTNRKKNNLIWGGTRPGSGRPSTGRKKYQFYITESEYTQLKQLLDKLRQPSE
jgi:hypothetical protein